ncbi:hypothetical protein MPER_13159 [Moniliophthora perniciosa FA553]|nr:hypothetical protein MPER_13159 [Moniliophthora perniciosa FA553]
MHHVKSFGEFVKSCARLARGLPASPPQYSPEMLSAFEALADVISPTIASPDVAEASTSTLNAPMSSASMSTSIPPTSTSRKRSQRNSDSSSETSQSPTPELSSSSDEGDDNEVNDNLCGIKLPKGRKMGPYLAAELKKMSEKERTMKMLVYLKYTQKDLDKANIEAKQRLVDVWLGDDGGPVSEDDEEQVDNQGSTSLKGKGKEKEKSPHRA